MSQKYTDIGINLTNRQFQNEVSDIIQKAVAAGVEQMILTGTSVRNSEQSAFLAKKIRADCLRRREFIRTTRNILTVRAFRN